MSFVSVERVSPRKTEQIIEIKSTFKIVLEVTIKFTKLQNRKEKRNKKNKKINDLVINKTLNAASSLHSLSLLFTLYVCLSRIYIY